MQPRNLKWEKNKNMEVKNKASNLINKRPWKSVYYKYAQIWSSRLLLFMLLPFHTYSQPYPTVTFFSKMFWIGYNYNTTLNFLKANIIFNAPVLHTARNF